MKILHHTFLFGFILGLGALLCMAQASTANAASRTWDGGGSDAKWSTCANWSSNACPTASDSVTFNTTSTKSATLDSSAVGTVTGLTISTGYTGTITQSRSLTINGNYAQAAGTFLGDTANIDINGTYTLSGGSFTSTSGTLFVSAGWANSAGTFVHNNGSVELDGGTSTMNLPGKTAVNFYNFRINKNNGVILTVSSGDTVVVNGALNLSEGRWATGTIQSKGAVNIASAWDGNGTGLFNITSTNETITIPGELASNLTQTITLNGTGSTLSGTGSGTIEFAALTLTSGTLNMDGYNVSHSGVVTLSGGTYTAGSGSKTFAGTFTLNSGVFNGGSSSLGFTGIVSLTGGSFTATSGTLTASKAWTRGASGSFFHNNGTVEFNGAGATIDVPNTESFYKLRINSTGTKTIGALDAWTIFSDLTIINGLLSGSTASIQLNGNLTLGADADAMNVPLTLSGTGTQMLSTAVNNIDGDLTINKLGGSVELSQALVLNASSQDLKIQNGSFALNGNNLSVNGSSGTLIVQSTGILELNGNETLTANTNYPSLQAGSTVLYEGTAGPYTLKNYSYQNLIISSDSNSLFNLPASKTIAGNLTILSGIFSQNGFNLSVTGTFSNEGTLRRLGAETFTGLMDTSSGTVEYSGDGDLLTESFTITDFGAGTDYFDLKINDQNSAKDSFALSAILNIENSLTIESGEFKQNAFSIHASALTLNGGTFTGGNANVVITGDLTLNSGTLSAPTANLSIYEDWNRSGGTFSHNNGTVSFASSTPSVISGDNHFNHLNSINPGKFLAFTAGSTQTVSGQLNLTGSLENPLLLQSSESGMPWYLISTGSQNVSYVDVSDSNASGGNPIQQVSSLNSGNNVHWVFNVAPVLSELTAQQSTDGTGLASISFVVEDTDQDAVETQIEYSTDGGDTWASPTLAGQTNFSTTSGPSSALLNWNARLDLPADAAHAQIRITPNDGTESGVTIVSDEFVLDFLPPSAVTNFNHMDFSDNHIILTWLPASDSNFKHYEIWHGEGEASAEMNSLTGESWGPANDAALSLASTNTVRIDGRDPRWKYFKIFTIDDFGNITSSPLLFIAASFTQNHGNNTSSNSTVETPSSTEISLNTSTETESTVTTTPTPEQASINLESFWKNFAYPLPVHWSSGYLKHLQLEQKVANTATSAPTLLSILVEIFVSPNGAINRGESLEFLMSLSSYEVSDVTLSDETQSIFTDVPPTYERSAYIDYAYQQGLINGYPDRTFRPTQTISRAEALKIVARFFNETVDTNLQDEELLSLYDLDENPFNDVDLNEWYAPYLLHAYSKGVIKGYEDGSFKPDSAVSYAEFLKISLLSQNPDVVIAEE
ncbi:MAG: S-layer homology domain-containing protein [Patescibacteria group bacterium]